MKTLVILTLLFCSIGSYTQNKFKEGYIITLKKDTIKGLVMEQTAVEAVSNCQFKTSESDPVQTFQIGFLEGYGFIRNGKNFVNHQIKFKNGTTHRGYFERLTSGRVTLYYYINEIDGNVTYFLFEKEGEEPIYITNKRTEIPKEEREDGLYYKKMLRKLFEECPPLKEDINNTLFNKKSFTQIAKKYNSMMGAIENISLNMVEP